MGDFIFTGGNAHFKLTVDIGISKNHYEFLSGIEIYKGDHKTLDY